ncbi:acyl-CoA dehydrogenase family protein [Nonomuraea lactucae]|uniref:acyl-CoA dehydrogenase family protein n=1 Tax=Nonomuraea lactucae TaxID=2249762 RepID=UPI000DE39FF0|nr:acyl-CoA dehydrogenase family protein [Nonomuraea lactucae]
MNTLTEIDRLLVDTALRLCADHGSREALEAAEAAGWSEQLWNALVESGLTRVGISEAEGGSGGTAAQAAELVRISGYAAAPVPLAESLLVGGPILAAAGISPPDGPLAVAPETGRLTVARRDGCWTVSGRIAAVPWARMAELMVALASGETGPVVVAVPLADAGIVPGRNYAGEPRDTVTVSGVVVAAPTPAADAGVDATTWRLRGALARSLQIAGALERVLELTVRHAKEREQFGRPIARFQAVGHMIALLGEAVAQARMAAETAAAGARPDDAAIAKIIAGEAATKGAALAHQVHGAMGTTRECDLQWFTRRLWSWRDEFGSETEWARALGAELGRGGAGRLWEVVTATPEEQR